MSAYCRYLVFVNYVIVASVPVSYDDVSGCRDVFVKFVSILYSLINMMYGTLFKLLPEPTPYWFVIAKHGEDGEG